MGKLMKFSLFALLVAGIALALVDPTPADAWNKEVISVRCGFDNGPNVWEVRQCGSSLAGICGNDEPCDELEGNGDGASANCAVCFKNFARSLLQTRTHQPECGGWRGSVSDDRE